MNNKYEYTFKLNREGIDKGSSRAGEMLAKWNVSKKDILRYILGIEDICIDTMEYYGCDTDNIDAKIEIGRRQLKNSLTLSIAGPSYNVLATSEAEGSALGNGILKHVGLAPEYEYARKTNIYSYRLKKKQVHPFLSLIIAISAAILCGFMGIVLPADLKTLILDGFLTPFHDAFLNVLGCIAGPMVFLSISWGIYGIGDAVTLKKIGSKLLGRFILILAIVAIVFGVVTLPAFQLQLSNTEFNATHITDVLSMILGFIPANVVEPFATGNTMQIIFLGFVVGIALLFLGQRTQAVANAVGQINNMIQFLIEIISKLVPYFIFIVLLEMFWSDMLDVFNNVARLFIVFIVSTVILDLATVINCAIINRANPFMLIKKCVPSLLIALTTASSAASFGTNLDACQNKLGIDEKLTSFGLPLSMVALKQSTLLNFLAVAYFFAKQYNVEISLAWVISTLFTVIILSFATPPIPGGALSAYTVLLLQAGIPIEALPVVLACDAIFDFLSTGADSFTRPMILLNVAKKLGLVDRKVLEKK